MNILPTCGFRPTCHSHFSRPSIPVQWAFKLFPSLFLFFFFSPSLMKNIKMLFRCAHDDCQIWIIFCTPRDFAPFAYGIFFCREFNVAHSNIIPLKIHRKQREAQRKRMNKKKKKRNEKIIWQQSIEHLSSKHSCECVVYTYITWFADVSWC